MKVKSSIQINIEEISTVKVQVQSWDVPENIFITNLPTDKIIPSPHSIHASISPIYFFLGFSNQAPPPFRVENIFFILKLDHVPFRFPTLSEEKKRIIETILQGRSIIGLGGLNIIKTLEKLITFSSDMEGLTNLSFKHHLAITGYMVFQTFMICAHFKSKWVEERRVMTEAID
ncbi:hypothetical protein POTOM_027000 [Populus tomentosa]|uniref:Uncharacterized protein n=1 Tax=Populus tomentosa TaxID=118781 RepID=A0A8X7ZBX6_POPTO|nr:hypothetical protein POTOM_027000 [Populus tomentosa]